MTITKEMIEMTAQLAYYESRAEANDGDRARPWRDVEETTRVAWRAIAKATLETFKRVTNATEELK
jgi:hypothetical protein